MRKEFTKEKQVLDLARKAKILRVQDLTEKGIIRNIYGNSIKEACWSEWAVVFTCFRTRESPATFLSRRWQRRYRVALYVYCRRSVSTILARKALPKSGLRFTENLPVPRLRHQGFA